MRRRREVRRCRWELALAAAWAGLAAAGPAAPAEATGLVHSAWVPPGYVLDWHDEFDGRLDANRWANFLSERRRGWVKLAREAVSNDPSGAIVLHTFLQDGEAISAWLTTQPSYRRCYGYFEARIRPQSTRGLHGAFWLMSAGIGSGANRPADSGAEIDIMKYAGDAEGDLALSHGVFWNAYQGTPVLVTNSLGIVRSNSNAPPQRMVGTMVDLAAAGLTNAPLSADYHVFGLRWTEREYVFTVDGVETYRVGLGVSKTPQFMCLSLLPPPDPQERPAIVTLPASMWVDYVRVYVPSSAPLERVGGAP